MTQHDRAIALYLENNPSAEQWKFKRRAVETWKKWVLALPPESENYDLRGDYSCASEILGSYNFRPDAFHLDSEKQEIIAVEIENYCRFDADRLDMYAVAFSNLLRYGWKLRLILVDARHMTEHEVDLEDLDMFFNEIMFNGEPHKIAEFNKYWQDPENWWRNL